MSWQLHQLGQQGLGRHKDPWDKLNAALFDSNPFFDSDFTDSLLKYFAEGREWLCVHDSGGVVDGMLIIKPERWGKWSIFLPAQAQIGALLATDPGLVVDLVRSLPGLARSLVCFCQDPLYSPFGPLPDKLPLISVAHGPTISVALDGSFEDYWNARPRKLRQNTGRYARRLREAGVAMSLAHLDAAEAMPAAVERYGMLESLGWKGREGTAVHGDNVQGQFYRDVLTAFARRGKASVFELRFDDTVVAMRLCIASDNMLVMLKTAYDERYAEYAPGRLLLHAVLEREFNLRRFKNIEFYTHANIDQLAWATQERMIPHIKVFRDQATKTAYVWALRLREALRHRLGR